jgi:hypothetical protein
MNRIWMGALALTLANGAAMAVGLARADSLTCHEEQGRVCEIRESRMSATSHLNVDAAPNGGIRVAAWDKNEILVRAKVEAWGDTKDSATSVLRQVKISAEGDHVRAAGPKDEGWGKQGPRWSVSYEVMVPAKIDLNLRSVNGGVAVEGVHGSTDVQTVNGGVTVTNVAGHVRGETVNGGITVELAGVRGEGESVTLQTVNGGVTLGLPEGANAKVRAQTVHGGLSTDFSGAKIEKGAWGAGPNSLELNLGTGAGSIHLETVNGGVHVHKRAA